MIVTSEAIVLNARKHGETSKIVWAYTKEWGKLSVIAKGAREVKSKFGGALEMFAHSSLTFYKKERSEGLYLLSKAELIETNRGILNSLESIEAATEIVELIIKTMHDEEKNDDVFSLLTATLSAISATPAAAPALHVRFYIEFARISGFALQPELEDELPTASHGVTDHPYRFHFATGEIHAYGKGQEYFPGTIALSNAATMTLVKLSTSTTQQAQSVRMTPATLAELRSIFTNYFTHHFAGFAGRSLKSANVFNALGRKP